MSFFVVLGMTIISVFFYVVTLVLAMNAANDLSNNDGLEGAIGVGFVEAIVIGLLLAKMKGVI